MILVGPAGYPPGSKGGTNAIERTKELGLTALEVQFGRGINLSAERAMEMGSKAKDLGIALSIHAPYYINFNSKPETVEKSHDWLMRSLRIADIMDARIVVVHAASYMGSTSEQVTNRVIEAMRRVREQMELEDLHSIIGLETMGKLASWGTLQEIALVIDEVDGIEPVPDFGHIHARYGGNLRTSDDFQEVLDSVFQIHQGHLHCHFSCIEYTDKGERRHLLLETKEPDFALLAPLIRTISGDLTIISETPAPSEDAVRMVSMLV
ncbi:MAG: TIM barrel protein [Euryarchaeota archaeon]|nr:TIM barrel protein [Euryarchaeota archaeon]